MNVRGLSGLKGEKLSVRGLTLPTELTLMVPQTLSDAIHIFVWCAEFRNWRIALLRARRWFL
jgi:hypothetical protein